jgi:hypothetical protein
MDEFCHNVNVQHDRSIPMTNLHPQPSVLTGARITHPAGTPRETETAPVVTRSRFIVTALVASAINLLLNAGAYALFLRDFFRAHPSGSDEFMRQLNRSPEQLIVWAMAVTSLTMGLFITTVMCWSGARSFVTGLKLGGIVGLLFWVSVNSGLYASSNLFSLPSVLVDTPFSALSMAVSAACAAWVLHRDTGPKAPGLGHAS